MKMFAAGSAYNAGMEITLTELEEAINYWRLQRPSLGEECALSPEVNALAAVYAAMIIGHHKVTAIAQLNHTCQQLIEKWRDA
jgi:hypothetical protein